jgi:D-cysteine desulfhydrase
VGTVIHASGSGGTQAGLAVGLAHRTSRPRLLGVSVGADEAEMLEKVGPLTASLSERLPCQVEPLAIEVTDRYIGDDYGIPTGAAVEGIHLVAETEGILLDPVYTGKAMAALIDLVRIDGLPPGDVVFVHTGGWPALYAYLELFDPRDNAGTEPIRTETAVLSKD